MFGEFICKYCKVEFARKYQNSSVPQYCSRQCSNSSITSERKAKIANTLLGNVPWNKGTEMWKGREHPRGALGKKFPVRSGPNWHTWRGGVSTENEKARKSAEYKQWRKAVFERDNYTCQICKTRGGKLVADHIENFAHHPELRLVLENGRTLCEPCHFKTDNYGAKALKLRIIKQSS